MSVAGTDAVPAAVCHVRQTDSIRDGSDLCPRISAVYTALRHAKSRKVVQQTRDLRSVNPG